MWKSSPPKSWCRCSPDQTPLAWDASRKDCFCMRFRDITMQGHPVQSTKKLFCKAEMSGHSKCKKQLIAETGVRHFMSHYLWRILSWFWEMGNWDLICKASRAAGETLPSIADSWKSRLEDSTLKHNLLNENSLYFGKAVPQGNLSILSLSVNVLHHSCQKLILS